MTTLAIIITVYVLIALVFLGMLAYECRKEETEFNFLHTIVAFFWPVIITVYAYVRCKEWIRKKWK